MTETEQIAAVVVAAVRAATASLLVKCGELEAKIVMLEARAPVQGEKGDRGDRGETGPKGHDGMGTPGTDGRDGIDGTDAPAVDVEDVARRAAALVPVPKDGKDASAEMVSAVVDAALTVRAADDLSPEDVASALTDLFRKELAVDAMTFQKRILRDAQGRVSGVENVVA